MTRDPSTGERDAYGIVERPHDYGPPRKTSGPCVEYFAEPAWRRCGDAGTGFAYPCCPGRTDAQGGPYCAQHGGEHRAAAEARQGWNYLAPASVGDAEAVQRAGTECLRTPDRYIVLRQTTPEQGGTWLAWLGLGSMTEAVPNPTTEPNRRGGQKHKRAHKPRAETGTLAFDTREAAERRARALWQARLDHHIEEIRRMRGGSTGWGVPVEAASEPIVLVLEQLDSRSAWDLAVTLPRQSRDGLCVFTGLRPSGEVA